jgi:hypothetical protein
MSNDVNLTLGICHSFVIRISSLAIHLVSHLIDKRPQRCHLARRVRESVQSYGTSGLH